VKNLDQHFQKHSEGGIAGSHPTSSQEHDQVNVASTLVLTEKTLV